MTGKLDPQWYAHAMASGINVSQRIATLGDYQLVSIDSDRSVYCEMWCGQSYNLSQAAIAYVCATIDALQREDETQ